MFRWLLLFFCLAGLIMVRGLETKLFYDPFLEYFHGNFKYQRFPYFEWLPLVFGYVFRGILNIVFSVGIIYALFRDTEKVKQGIVLMSICFVIIFPFYLWSIANEFKNGYLIAFYLRRFVIQPVILLLIIPIFYYQKILSERIK